MNNYGKVSIITPSWNCGKYVEETIRSIQNQTYENWELLFQDDCSTDSTYVTIERLSAVDSRIKYACNPQNSGAAISRNNALRRATGRWIAFLDSDDLWEPTKLEKQIAFMVENGYHFSYTNHGFVDENTKQLPGFLTGPKHITEFGMFSYCWIGCLTVIYDRDYIGDIQIKDIKKNNDYAIWLKVIKKANCYLLDEKLGSYRIRLGSISHHSKISLIKWHYQLFREAEEMTRVKSIIFTIRNLVCGVYKKLVYFKKSNK